MVEKQDKEFKSIWKDEYLSWICGFANSQGGSLYIGMDDDGHPIGLSNSRKLLEDIPNKIRDAMGITVNVNLHTDGNYEYIEIQVPAYPLAISCKGSYYYRSGSTNQKLSGPELESFILRRRGVISQDKIMLENENKILKAKVSELERLARKFSPISEDSKVASVHSLVDRFIGVYESHGILVNQIPMFCDNKFGLKIVDFENKTSIMGILSDNLLTWTCNRFGIQRDWLDGGSNRIYQHQDYYKRVWNFIELISKLKSEFQNDFDIFALKKGMLEHKSERQQYVVLVLRRPIGLINGKTIYGFMPISTLWNWGYWRSRYQLKSIFWACKKIGIDIQGHDLDSNEIIKISSALVFPKLVLDKIPYRYTWYTEDYVDFPEFNVQAKESDEVNLIFEYIREEKYDECLKNACRKYNLIRGENIFF